MNHFARLPYPEYDADEYQAILDWLATASVDQILGAVSLASVSPKLISNKEFRL